MNTFKILRHVNTKYEAVKVGWSWPAFFFCPIWLIVKKLHYHWIPIWVGIILLSIAVPELPSGIGLILGIVYGIIGNKLVLKSLLKKEYVSREEIQAISKKKAISMYLNELYKDASLEIKKILSKEGCKSNTQLRDSEKDSLTVWKKLKEKECQIK